MEILFYLIIFYPILLWLIWFLINNNSNWDLYYKNYQLLYLKIYSFIYLIMFIIWIYLYINWFLINNQIFFLDWLNYIFFLLILILSFLITTYSISYFWMELKHWIIFKRLKSFNILINFFIFCMLILSTCANINIMWIALEWTTICTTFLISFYNTKTTWEAAWKYIIICWTWLIIAHLWIFLLVLWWLNELNINLINTTNFENINIDLIKIAFILILIWFWTKVWFFPMNTWLPDAHWKCPTPISSFMSSILLPLAFYIILRIKYLIDMILWDPSFTNSLFLFFWISSVVYSWIVMLVQIHYKRALAYSSIENMWLIAIAFWLWTPLSTILWFLHIIWHSFLKCASFMSVWNILLHQWTWKFENIKNLLWNMQTTWILTIISILLLVWLPPSPLFFTELWIIYIAFNFNIFISIIISIWLILVFSWILINFSKLYEKWIIEDDKTKNIEEDNKISFIHIPIIISILLWIFSIWYIFL